MIPLRRVPQRRGEMANWWNAAPGELIGDDDGRYDDPWEEDDNTECCVHGIPFCDPCEACEDATDD